MVLHALLSAGLHVLDWLVGLVPTVSVGWVSTGAAAVPGIVSAAGAFLAVMPVGPVVAVFATSILLWNTELAWAILNWAYRHIPFKAT